MYSDPVQAQYERLPYPPIPWFALPARGTGRELALEPHDGARILVAGAGSFEALVVAQAHPRAADVVALEPSSASLRALQRRLRLARLVRRGLPRVRLAQGRIEELSESGFDYVLASNVLHHCADPAAALGSLSRALKIGGTLRMVTYPCQSRIFMRQTSRYLRAQGLSADSPRLLARARRAIRALPPGSIRSCFESQPETQTRAGLVDAFFNARELPLRPLQWKAATLGAGLELVREAQTETSRSTFLEELLPETAALGSWEKLQILDDLLELCVNPVLWLRKVREPIATKIAPPATDQPWSVELALGLRRARRLLARAGVSLESAIETLRMEVGPRTDARGRTIPGLTIPELYLELGALELDAEDELDPESDLLSDLRL